jgi:excisionase family DNA binding protein
MKTHNDIGIHMETENFITVNQACKHLGISRPYIYKLMAKKDLPYYMVGSVRRFKTSELDSWAEKKGESNGVKKTN